MSSDVVLIADGAGTGGRTCGSCPSAGLSEVLGVVAASGSAALLTVFTPDLYWDYPGPKWRGRRRPSSSSDMAAVMARYGTETSTEHAL